MSAAAIGTFLPTSMNLSSLGLRALLLLGRHRPVQEWLGSMQPLGHVSVDRGRDGSAGVSARYGQFGASGHYGPPVRQRFFCLRTGKGVRRLAMASRLNRAAASTPFKRLRCRFCMDALGCGLLRARWRCARYRLRALRWEEDPRRRRQLRVRVELSHDDAHVDSL